MTTGAPRLTVSDIELYERGVDLRLPFRFGVTTVTRAEQAVARVRITLEDGRSARGVGAESLAAKWFDKNLALSDAQNLDQLRQALGVAAELYRAHGPATAFGLFAGTYGAQMERCAALGLNPLVASFGPALLDRAVIDALGKLTGRSFPGMVAANIPGIAVTELTPDIDGFELDGFLAGLRMRPTIDVRHTVGLLDPLTAGEQRERVNDGLPETLEEVAEQYGCRFYKLKVSGDVAADLDRLGRIAHVLDRLVGDYRCTLDGNEQYGDVDGIVELWRRMEETPALRHLVHAVLFIEQPIKRAVALSHSVKPLAQYRPVIVDESDGELDSFVQAEALGYDGVSSKTCKGFYKSILNAARARHWNETTGEERFFLSAEDLTTWAGVSVQQDLALVATLGLVHVERNGHHFIDGMGFASEREQQSFLAAHGDLYQRGARGPARLAIRNGHLALGSLDCAGFAVAADTDWNSLRPSPAPPAGPIAPAA